MYSLPSLSALRLAGEVSILEVSKTRAAVVTIVTKEQI